MSDPNSTQGSSSYISITDDQTRLRIDLDQEQARKLEERAVAALNAIPRRGMEIGGILLGHTGAEAEASAGTPNHCRLVIESFQEVVCQHLFGPSYRLSEQDHLAWRDALTSTPPLEESFLCLGMFRSVTEGDLSLNEQDIKMIGAFRDLLVTDASQRVFLLLKPSKSGENLGRIALWNAENIRYLPPFPLPVRSAVRSMAEADDMPVYAAAEAEQPESPPDATAMPKTETSAESELRYVKPSLLCGPFTAWIPITAGVCVIAVAVSFYLLSNRGLATVELNGPARDIGEFTAAPAQEPKFQIPPARLDSSAVYRDERQEPTIDDLPGEKTVSAGSAPPLEMKVPLRGEPAGASSANSGNSSARVKERFSRAPRQPEFTMHVDSPSKSHIFSGMWNALSPMRLFRRIRGGSSTETARPTFAAQPEIPTKFRSLLRGGEHVDVKIAIDKRGKVVRAVAPKQGREKDGWLTASVVAAAYQWEFRPARISQEPVDSTAMLHFVFEHPSGGR